MIGLLRSLALLFCEVLVFSFVGLLIGLVYLSPISVYWEYWIDASGVQL